MKQFKTIFLSIFFLFTLTTVLGNESMLFSAGKVSSNRITCISQDLYGFIWIGTEYGLNKYDGYRFTTYKYKGNDAHSLTHNNIAWVQTDRQGRLLVMTASGLCRYRYDTNNFQRYYFKINKTVQPRVCSILEEPNGNVLVGTASDGLFELTHNDTIAHPCNRYKTADNKCYRIMYRDNQRRVWIVDNINNIYCYTPKGNEYVLSFKTLSTLGAIHRFAQDKLGEVLIISENGTMVYSHHQMRYSHLKLDNHIIKSCMVNHRGNLLLGMSGNGVLVNPAYKDWAIPLAMNNSLVDMRSAVVSAIFEDKDDNLWVGCYSKGVLFYPAKKSVFSNWKFSNQKVLTGSAVYAAATAPDGVWCSMKDGGLYHFDNKGNINKSYPAPASLNFVYRDRRHQYWVGAGTTLYRFNPLTGTCIPFVVFDCDFISSMSDDGKGHLFVSTEAHGLSIVDETTKQVKNYNIYQTNRKNGNISNNWVQSFCYDHHGLLWMGTAYGVSCLQPETGRFNTFGWSVQLPGVVCYAVAETSDGNIVIGTDDGLFLFDRKQNKIARYPHSEGLKETMICSIVSLPNGDFWCSTLSDLWHYDARRQKFRQYANDKGLTGKEYIPRVGTMTSDHRLLFGNSDGFVVFNPLQLKQHQEKLAQLQLVDITIGDQSLSIDSKSNGHAITDKSILESNNFEFSYYDNTFTLYFSSFDYANTGDMVLQYRLNHEEWVSMPTGVNAITLTHLSPDNYELEVRAIINGTVSKTSTYHLLVKAPWFLTPWAYLVYILCLIGLALEGIRFYINRRKADLAEEKMQFLINATHDIRTPLTLILNPLHQLMTSKQHNDEEQKSFSTIDHNAHRILNLVNQILDIRKIDKQQMRLQCTETDLVPFVHNIFKAYEHHAADRNIKFRFEAPYSLMAWIDKAQFDKVIANLLSNAFKFTNDGGEIIIRMIQEEKSIRISVTDNGTGITEKDPNKLFLRFYQSPAGRISGKDGTGIGLNLCKMIVEMHHGKVQAANRTDGVLGSVFTVMIPMGKEQFKPEEIYEVQQQDPSAKKVRPNSSIHILLVDDDVEMTDFISNELSKYYHFCICPNGKVAMTELLTNNKKYDLVVSDIMMPEMDGLSMLRLIKSNPQVYHIPVILLTAESAIGNRLEGLNRGADGFLAKPFLIEELHLQIDNLLDTMQRIKGKFSGNTEQKNRVVQQDIPDNDKLLMDHVMNSVNKHLGDSDYSVERLATDVGLSRVQLHRKMKELTGISASEFVRNLRLEQAARLLKERRVNVSQVTYSLGYTNVSHFCRIFKQHFGLTPTEYAEKEEEKES